MNSSHLKFTDIDEYHSAQTKELIPILETMRQTIRDTVPVAEEVISYGMPAFKLNKVLVYYAACKSHIGFYPTSKPIEYFKEELQRYKTTKGAIQFPMDKPLPLELIRKIVLFRSDEDQRMAIKKKK